MLFAMLCAPPELRPVRGAQRGGGEAAGLAADGLEGPGTRTMRGARAPGPGPVVLPCPGCPKKPRGTALVFLGLVLATAAPETLAWDETRPRCLPDEDQYQPSVAHWLLGAADRQKRTFVLERNGWASQGASSRKKLCRLARLSGSLAVCTRALECPSFLFLAASAAAAMLIKRLILEFPVLGRRYGGLGERGGGLGRTDD